MTEIVDSGYGRQFADFYDRLFPGGPFVAATLDLARQEALRAELPALANRRADIYRLEAG